MAPPQRDGSIAIQEARRGVLSLQRTSLLTNPLRARTAQRNVQLIKCPSYRTARIGMMASAPRTVNAAAALNRAE
jgi:hypothetical protein